MDTINNDLTNLLQQMGVHQESLGITPQHLSRLRAEKLFF